MHTLCVSCGEFSQPKGEGKTVMSKHVSGFEGQRVAFQVRMFTSRGTVNVVIPGTGERREGNHHYARPKGAMSGWGRDIIAHAIDGENIPCVQRGYTIGRIDMVKRGEYVATVYMPKHNIPQRVIPSHGHGHNSWHVFRADGLQVLLTWNHSDRGRIMVRVFDNRADENAAWVDYTYTIVPGVADMPLTKSVWVAMEKADQWIDTWVPLFI